MVTRTTLTVVFCVVLLSMAVPSMSGFMQQVWQETPTTLHAEWTWSPESPGATGRTGSYWSTNLRIARFGWDPSTYRYEMYWQFKHLVAPHEGDVAPGPLFEGSGAFAYSSQDANGTIISQSGFVTHPANHEDTWNFTFYRDLDPSKSRIVLNVSHTPEPSSLLTLGAGAVGLLGLRRRKR